MTQTTDLHSPGLQDVKCNYWRKAVGLPQAGSGTTQFILAIALACVTASQLAADMAGAGSGVAIPDNNPAGVNTRIVFTANEVISRLWITIDFGTINNLNRGHTYVGDLVVRLQGPGGTVTVFDRPGVPATAFGDSSNLAGVYRWEDGGLDFSAAAGSVNNNQIVANGTYNPQDANDNFLSFNSVFAGTQTAGSWTLTFYDLASGDVGGIAGWTLNIISSPIPVPEPSMFPLSLAGVAVGRRLARRKRKQNLRQRRRVYYG